MILRLVRSKSFMFFFTIRCFDVGFQLPSEERRALPV
jgi:hypothetical protein